MLTEQDHSLIRRETGIPGMRYLLEPSGLLDLIRQNGEIRRLDNLEPGYLRYKPGMNCIARFQFIRDGEKHFAYAKAFGKDAAGKISKALEREDPGSVLGPGRVALRDEGILFSVFPNDARLRSVGKLQDPSSRSNLLKRLFKSQPGWESASFSPLNYKPARRFVAKFQRPDGESATVKFYSRTEFSRVREFRKHLESTPGVRVPDWIGGSKSHHALAFSWLNGTTLRENQGAGRTAAMTGAGSILARFHRGHQHRFKPRSAKKACRRTIALAAGLCMILPEITAQADQLARELSVWRAGLKRPELPVHGDFYDKQVLVDGSKLALIDSDDAHLGDPLDDIACFVAHLERHAINGLVNHGDIGKDAGSLIEGYREVNPGLELEDLDRHVAFSLFQLVHHPFRDRADNWPDQTRALLNRCKVLFESA